MQILVARGASTFAISESMGCDCIAVACGNTVSFFTFNMATLKFKPMDLGKGSVVTCNDQITKMGNIIDILVISLEQQWRFRIGSEVKLCDNKNIAAIEDRACATVRNTVSVLA